MEPNPAASGELEIDEPPNAEGDRIANRFRENERFFPVF
jgi:hypothetical protein